MPHPLHELLSRWLDAGRLAPGAEATDSGRSGRESQEPNVIGDPFAGAVGTLHFEQSHDRSDARGN